MGCCKSKAEPAGTYDAATTPTGVESGKAEAPKQQDIGAPASVAPPAAKPVQYGKPRQESLAEKQIANGGASDVEGEDPPLLTKEPEGTRSGNKAAIARIEAAGKNNEVPVLFPEVWLMSTEEDGAETFERKPVAPAPQLDKQVRTAPKAGAKRKANSGNSTSPRPMDRRVEPLQKSSVAAGPPTAKRVPPRAIDASEQELLSDVADTRIQLDDLDQDLDFTEVAGRRSSGSRSLGLR
mmetsp:Transcript_59156/g.132589  ORF Transcript_59156/g.132589 Transcript_59156/m.132589 type:complete len:238 (-) Transcript_59156:54-767(-)